MTIPQGEPWCCKSCNTVLGHRIRKHENDRHIEVLVTLAGPELIGYGRVPCICGAVRCWEPGEAAMDELIRRVQQARKTNCFDRKGL
jgi:hypothetical protein